MDSLSLILTEQIRCAEEMLAKRRVLLDEHPIAHREERGDAALARKLEAAV